MNYFAHALPFLDRPYFVAGTAIPDWLSVVNRRVRVKSKSAAPYVADTDPITAEIAAGVVQHHNDDEWFHRTRAFAELSWRFTLEIRDQLPADRGFRPSFLGHILVEILLDASLIEEFPGELDRYYELLDSLDAQGIADAVNRMAPRPVEQMAAFVPRFSAERFLYDYAEDGKLLNRLNRVMQRVGLAELPDSFCRFLAQARPRVQQHKSGLLEGRTKTDES